MPKNDMPRSLPMVFPWDLSQNSAPWVRLDPLQRHATQCDATCRRMVKRRGFKPPPGGQTTTFFSTKSSANLPSLEIFTCFFPWNPKQTVFLMDVWWKHAYFYMVKIWTHQIETTLLIRGVHFSVTLSRRADHVLFDPGMCWWKENPY